MTYLFDPGNWKWLFEGANLKFLLQGFLVNVEIALISMVLSLIVGLFLALAKISKKRWLSVPAGLWIDVWRNLPLIFIIFYLFIGMPKGMKDAWQNIAPGFLPDAFDNPAIVAAIVGLTLYNSAVIAEIMRAGIQSLERGQGEAAISLGMTYGQAMRLIILPQGLRRMVPATVSQLITLTKDTSLVSIISIQEAIRHSRIVVNTSGNPFTGSGVDAPLLHVFIFTGLLFVAFNLTLSRISRRLEIRERRLTGTTVERVTGLEDQVAAEADVA